MKKTCAFATALLLASTCFAQAQEFEPVGNDQPESETPAPKTRARGPVIDQGEDAADEVSEHRSVSEHRGVSVTPHAMVAERVSDEDVTAPEDQELDADADAARHALAARNWAIMRQQAAAAAAYYAPGPVGQSGPVTPTPHAAPTGNGQPQWVQPAFGQPYFGAPQFMPSQHMAPQGMMPAGAFPYPQPGFAPQGYAPMGYGPYQQGMPAPSQAPAEMVGDQPDIEPQPVRVRRDGYTGHFVATVLINGVKMRAIIDTGAMSTVLSPQDARASGAIKDITHAIPAAGIGGVTNLNVTRVRSFVIGGRNLGGFSAMIGAEGIPHTLLGQTELRRLGRIVIEDDVLTIEPKGTRIAAR